MAPPRILFSIDLEDHTGRYEPNGRYIANTQKLLEYLSTHNLHATFFTVGKIGEQVPQLVHSIAESGHEIACHSYDHTPLPQQTASIFREQTKKAKDILEQASGYPVCGYRAPVFSLTPQTPWVPSVLSELGFMYSSSVVPHAHVLYSYPGLPATPFHWPDGLTEFPVVFGTIANFRFPFLGGVYLRYCPTVMIKKLLANLPPDMRPWTYIHPYDIDVSERDWVIEGAPLWQCLLLWCRRGATFNKLNILLPYFHTMTFQQVCQKLNESGMVFPQGAN